MRRVRLTIRVRSTGSDNKARVVGHAITASATSSPTAAAMAAAKKVLGEAPVTISRDLSFTSATNWVRQYVVEGEMP